MAASKDDFLFVLEAATAAFKSGDGKTLRRLRVAAQSELTSSTRKSDKTAADSIVKGGNDGKLREKFSRFENREELQRFLSSSYPRKSDIEPLLRSLRVPVIKTDAYEAMVDKIVDATVGYRLRSQAIRGSGQIDS
ncbi:hypothetical protein HTK96_07405 [Brevundimonas vesicularis]|uniref:hypothetical protein n=1 Tax=Brevundimonas vesicularis TaxID=41276 RepID=UPI001571E4FC|nr:hypothetical protein [Brevundimonas vesicularis]NSX33193.1 hypothetical protein [Brevundimonas vesicularis]